MFNWWTPEEQEEVASFTEDTKVEVEQLEQEYEDFKSFVKEKIDEYNEKMYGVSEEEQ